LAHVDREIDRFVGDRIYDHEEVYEAVDLHSPGADVVVPPRKDAVLSNKSISVPSYRDRHIAEKIGISFLGLHQISHNFPQFTSSANLE